MQQLVQLRLVAFAAFAAGLGLSTHGFAQSGTSLDRYEPSEAGDQLAAVPDVASDSFSFDAELRLSLAGSPLILVTEDSRQRIVSDQLLLHSLFKLSLWERLNLGVDVPVVLQQSGESSTTGIFLTAPHGASFADLRLSSQLLLLKPKSAVPGVSVRASAWLPTGNVDEYAGSGSVRLEPALVVGANQPRYAWGASLGRRFQLADQSDSLIGAELLARAGGGPRWGPFLLTAEVLASFQEEQESADLFDSAPHVEGLLHGRFDLGGWFVRAGGGAGFTQAIGTPAYRFLLGIGFSPTELFGEKKNNSPQSGASKRAGQAAPVSGAVSKPASSAPTDRDGDGFVDLDDQCADVPGSARGCPTDTDGDGIYDPDDACVEQVGSAHPSAKHHGCPQDQDGDGIFDATDACPHEKGAATDDPKTTGCPKSVRIEGAQILILQKIVFGLRSDQIAEESYPILQEVSELLAAHPEIELVVIEGHTDSGGSLETNLDLSRRRALSVMHWLIEHEVDELRLQSTGFGPKRPLASNDTPEGRARNRRVEFRIVSDAEKETAK